MEEEVDKDGSAGGRRGSKSGGKYSKERRKKGRRKGSSGGSILMNTRNCWYQGKTCTNMTLEFLTNLLAMPKTEFLNKLTLFYLLLLHFMLSNSIEAKQKACFTRVV